MRWRHLRSCLRVLTACVLLAGCGGDPGARAFERDARSVAELCRPSDVAPIQYFVSAQRERGHQASWQFDTDLDWERYLDSIRDRMTTFEATTRGARSASFARWKGGDSWVLVLEANPAGGRTHIRATLDAFPN